MSDSLFHSLLKHLCPRLYGEGKRSNDTLPPDKKKHEQRTYNAKPTDSDNPFIKEPDLKEHLDKTDNDEKG